MQVKLRLTAAIASPKKMMLCEDTHVMFFPEEGLPLQVQLRRGCSCPAAEGAAALPPPPAAEKKEEKKGIRRRNNMQALLSCKQKMAGKKFLIAGLETSARSMKGPVTILVLWCWTT